MFVRVLSSSCRARLVALTFWAVAACEPALDSQPSGREQDDSAAMPGDAGIRVGDAQSSVEPCGAGDALSCACPPAEDGTLRMGSRICLAGKLGACACPDVAPPNQDDLDTCKPGYYTGQFTGNYTSTLGLLEVPLALSGVASGDPAVSFTLVRAQGAPGSYLITNGRIRSNVSDAYELTATMTGTLDCGSKTFVGELDGATGGLAPESFSGELTANYDDGVGSFVRASWYADSDSGERRGNGMWSAAWVAASAP